MSRGALWTARVLSALGVLFLLFDATIKVAMIHPVTAPLDQVSPG